MDYYAVLGLNWDADLQAVQKAYRNLAIKWHPLRCDDPDAQANFDEVSEAFEVLSNHDLRALFDKFGEAGLKEGVPDNSGGYLGGNYAYAQNGDEIFESFFGTANPFATIVEAATAIDPTAAPVLEPSSKSTIFESITLEDIFNGVSKTINLGARHMSFDVKPSFTSGSTLVFKDDGTGSGEVLVVLEQEKHALFSREGSSADLHYTASISVLDSLVGCSVEVTSLSGKTFKVPVTDVVYPGFTKTMAGAGLPDGMGGFGDLILHFEIKFPTSLRPEQKMLLNTALALPKTLTKEQQLALVGVKNSFAR